MEGGTISSTYLERRFLHGYLPLEGVDPPEAQGLPVLLPPLLGLLLLVLGLLAAGLATGSRWQGGGVRQGRNQEGGREAKQAIYGH